MDLISAFIDHMYMWEAMAYIILIVYDTFGHQNSMVTVKPRVVLQLSLANPLKLGVKSIMKM